MIKMTIVLLQNKLHIPTLRPRQVIRHRLLDRLDTGFQRKLTLVSAPAGFGKTTLLAMWLKMRGMLSAWLSLDPEDNDPSRFWAYFIAAVQTVHTGVGESMLTLLRSAVDYSSENFLVELVNELGEIASGDFVLVLDDFQVIEHPKILEGMLFLLDHLPPNLHLVLSTRADPPWPLGRLRGQAEITELRIVDLRLTLEESTEFLNSIMGLELGVEDVIALEARTEGWITGLQLAGLSMLGREDKTAFIHALTGSQQYILDYLVEETLDRQTVDMQEFLLKTSILDRLAAPVCDTVTQRLDSHEMLALIEKSNLFLFPLDDERHWFRYHALFADLLRSRLQHKLPQQVSALHARASEWFAAYDMLSEAVRHAILSGDIDLLARVIEENALAVITVHTEHLSDLAGWLNALPDHVFRSRPLLAIARGWILAYSGELEAAEAVITEAEELILQLPVGSGQVNLSRQQLEGYLAAIRGYCLLMNGDTQGGAEWVEKALKYLPMQDVPTRVFFTIVLGSAIGQTGDLPGGIRVLTEAANRWRGIHNPLLPIMILCELAGLQLLSGQLHQVSATCEEIIRLANDYVRLIGVYPPVVSFAFARLSYVLREWNDLEGAIHNGRRAVQIARDWGQRDSQNISRVYLALALQAGGKEEEAQKMIHQAWLISSEISPAVAAIAAAYEAWLDAARGDLPSIKSWAEQSDLQLEDELSFSRLREYTVYARYLFHQGKLSESLSYITRLLPLVEVSGAMLYEIELLTLQALAWYARGNLHRALLSLEKALRMAEPEGYVRIFIDEGVKMGELLQHAFGRGITIHYVRHLLSELQASQRTKSDSSWRDLANTLTPREMEILKLLMTSRSIAEIADELCITTNTLRTHIRNIYDKLQVHSRMEAVSLARQYTSQDT